MCASQYESHLIDVNRALGLVSKTRNDARSLRFQRCSEFETAISKLIFGTRVSQATSTKPHPAPRLTGLGALEPAKPLGLRPNAPATAPSTAPCPIAWVWVCLAVESHATWVCTVVFRYPKWVWETTQPVVRQTLRVAFSVSEKVQISFSERPATTTFSASTTSPSIRKRRSHRSFTDVRSDAALEVGGGFSMRSSGLLTGAKLAHHRGRDRHRPGATGHPQQRTSMTRGAHCPLLQRLLGCAVLVIEEVQLIV